MNCHRDDEKRYGPKIKHDGPIAREIHNGNFGCNLSAVVELPGDTISGW